MHQLIYHSQASIEITPLILTDILEVARCHNEREGVTGILFYQNDCFWQVLEGPEQAVHNVFEHILVDDRHRDVKLVCEHEVEQRGFGNWAMHFANTGEPFCKRLNERVRRLAERQGPKFAAALEPFMVRAGIA